MIKIYISNKQWSPLTSSPSSHHPRPRSHPAHRHKMNTFKPLSEGSSSSSSQSLKAPAPTTGGYINNRWIPFDIWPRIASYLTSTSDQISFSSVCQTSTHAIIALHSKRLRSVYNTFHTLTFTIPTNLHSAILSLHPLPPPNQSGLILFLDASPRCRGIDIAWLQNGILKKSPLGLQSIPATSVSNITFSPDATRIACLVTLANVSGNGPDGSADDDPLHRLVGWQRVVRPSMDEIIDVAYDPCEDCTVQIIELIKDDLGEQPDAIKINTFSHVFVPEYGFDMIWKHNNKELIFTAMLHSSSGAATYLVRWQYLNNSNNFVFMACIDGASVELLNDKKCAMLNEQTTCCTSRIELSDDAMSIFFDTTSKFGILKFDQINNASTTRVTRADLSNNLKKRIPVKNISNSNNDNNDNSSSNNNNSSPPRYAKRYHVQQRHALRQLNVGNPDDTQHVHKEDPKKKDDEDGDDDEGVRVSTMSPDGCLLCSLVCVGNVNNGSRHIEMRSSTTGRLMYRRLVQFPTCNNNTNVKIYNTKFDKSADNIQNVISFSKDSSLLILWNAHIHKKKIQHTKQIPLILDSQTGRTIQNFNSLNSIYDNAQISPDGLTIYATRILTDQTNIMDALDTTCGNVIKSINVGGDDLIIKSPCKFSSSSQNNQFAVNGSDVNIVCRGWADDLWQSTRGSVGCGWSGRRRLDEHEQYEHEQHEHEQEEYEQVDDVEVGDEYADEEYDYDYEMSL